MGKVGDVVVSVVESVGVVVLVVDAIVVVGAGVASSAAGHVSCNNDCHK